MLVPRSRHVCLSLVIAAGCSSSAATPSRRDAAVARAVDARQADATPAPEPVPAPPDSGAPPDAAAGGGGAAPVLELTDPADSMLYAPSMGGSDFTDACMPGQVIIGLRGTSGGMFQGLNTVEAFCGDIAVTGDGPFDVQTTADGLLGPHGMLGPTMYDGSCPPNQVVVGFDGQSGNWIDALTPYCAPVTVSGTPGAYTVDVGTPPAKLTTIVGDTSGGAPFPPVFCPEGKVAVGIAGGSGAAVDRFGLHCASLHVVP